MERRHLLLVQQMGLILSPRSSMGAAPGKGKGPLSITEVAAWSQVSSSVTLSSRNLDLTQQRQTAPSPSSTHTIWQRRREGTFSCMENKSKSKKAQHLSG